MRYRLLLASAALAAALSGCTSVEDWLRGRKVAEPREDVILGAPGTESYLEELQKLATGDPYTQVEIHADAEAAATLTPDPSTQLRYALVLATPGHAAADPETGASMLRELLAQTEMMTQSEVALATVYLKNVDERLLLEAEARRLRSASATAQSAEQRAMARRIADVEAENRRLRDALVETEEKLEAITSIERSIRAQDKETN
jgi:hypothetical protein